MRSSHGRSSNRRHPKKKSHKRSLDDGDRLVKHVEAVRRRTEKRTRRWRRTDSTPSGAQATDDVVEEPVHDEASSEEQVPDPFDVLVSSFIHRDDATQSHRIQDISVQQTDDGNTKDLALDQDSAEADDAEITFSKEEAASASRRQESHFLWNQDSNREGYEESSFMSVSLPVFHTDVGRLQGEIEPQIWLPRDSQIQIEPIESVAQLGIPDRMISRWISLVPKPSPLTKLQYALGGVLCHYLDVMVTARETSMVKTERSILRLVLVHAVAHLTRSRRRIQRNNLRLAELEKDKSNVEPEAVQRDQGFTRPTVLALLPMRNVAFEFITDLVALAVSTQDGDDQERSGQTGRNASHHVLNRKKFEEEFKASEEVDDIQGKPEDYQHWFRGNIDDDFKIGIVLSRKSVKLYSDFYKSDIIVASPLGMKRLLESPPEGETKESMSDFLSSIEICIVGGAGILAMQNWDHLVELLERLNRIPKKVRDSDISRVRELNLEGKADHFRQTILLGSHRTPELNQIFRTFSNHSGRALLMERFPSRGQMDKLVTLPTPHHEFIKIPHATTLIESSAARFEFFRGQLLPQILTTRRSHWGQTIIFIPSYFDYVRIRNLFISIRKDSPDTIRFSAICEHTRMPDVTRARTQFFHQRYSIFQTSMTFQPSYSQLHCV